MLYKSLEMHLNRGFAAFSSLLLRFHAAAFDPLDPNGNVTIKWDIISWTPDGYVAKVTMNNFQMYRQIANPGWTLGWKWQKKEIIWSVMGAQATEQGDCSSFSPSIPHSCKRNPTIVDLLPGASYNQQTAKCCKGGLLSSFGQDPEGSSSSFQVSIGRSGNNNHTVRLPRNFTLLGTTGGYTCGPTLNVARTAFLSPDGRRKTEAMMTWNVVCTYSQFLASKGPTCCVSFSSFYNDSIVPCPSCACACQKDHMCIGGSSHIRSVARAYTPTENGMVQCTEHLCPIRVHWHVKTNYKEYWRVKISITNFRYRFSYTEWTLVAQHPNLNNVTQVFSFNYHPLVPYQSTNDSGMFYGIEHYNDMLEEERPNGNVQSEMILRKDVNTFTFKEGWAFPRKVYFNGDECALPPPDSYPFLPNTAKSYKMADLKVVVAVILILLSTV